MIMLFYKCKNSVFCVCFLFFFLVGTISGIFAYYYLFAFKNSVLDTGVVISIDIPALFLSAARSLCVVAVFALHPQGHRAVFPLVFLRGFFVAYCFAALRFDVSPIWGIIAIKLFMLAAFYSVSRWVYFRWDGRASHQCV